MSIFYEVPLQFTVVPSLDTTTAQAGTTGSTVNILFGVDSSGNIYINGVAADGGAAVSSVFGRAGAVTANTGDYTVAKVTGAAPLASPTFTGVPAAPTATALTSTTQLATTAFTTLAVAVETTRATTAEGLLQPTSGRNTPGATGYSQLVAAPASAGAAGVAGQEAYDSGFYYRCIATNTWERVAIATW